MELRVYVYFRYPKSSRAEPSLSSLIDFLIDAGTFDHFIPFYDSYLRRTGCLIVTPASPPTHPRADHGARAQ